MSSLQIKELSHPAGEVLKMAADKTLDLYSQGATIMPIGSVLQVKSVPLTGRVALNANADTGAGVDVGLNVAITPKSSTSKFLITVNIGAAGIGSASSWGAILSRDGSKIGFGDDFANYSSGVMFRGSGVGHADYNHTSGGGSGQYLDTVSGVVGTSRTYILGFGTEGGALRINSDYAQYNGSATFVHSTTISTMTIAEIQG